MKAEIRPGVDLRLMLVTDRALLRGRSLDDLVREALAGGATCVQLREKTAGTREFIELARRIKPLAAVMGAALFINDRIDVALAAEADGVHVGQLDMTVADVRRLGPPGWVIGVSAESVEDARRAEADGADYIGASPVFATPTKADHAPPLGLAGLSAIRAATRLPVVAIGGIHADCAAEVMRAGADGLAVVSALATAESPRAAAESLRREMALAQPGGAR